MILRMKRYMVLWGALFFMVTLMSLYLMLETINSPKPYTFTGNQVLEGIEIKIQKIEKDLAKNQEMVSQIKHWVNMLSKGKSGVEEPSVPFGPQVIETLLGVNAPVEGQDNHDSQGGAPNGPEKPREPFKIEPGQKVMVTSSTCTATKHPPAEADIDMHKVFDVVPFDNQDGGVWKQGWDISYDANQWKQKPLQIFVVPHTHCDPGWIKTLDDYYRQQTRGIFENMLPKMEEDARRKFTYAEIAFFSMWWEELNDDRKERVRKLVSDGRLEILTGGWVMTDEANSHYFAMLDQLIEGHQWLNGTLGVKPQSGWAIDPFGYSSTMAYLLKRSGFENMLIQRVHYSIKKHFSREKTLEFMWQQQWDHEKSTGILCHMMPFYSYDIPHTCGPDPKICCQFDFRRLPGGQHRCPWKISPVPITPANVAERAMLLVDQYRKKAQLYRTNVLLAPLGDDFRYEKPEEWDFQFNNYQQIFDYINSHPEMGAVGQFGTLANYFDALHQDAASSSVSFPSLTGDFFTYADRDDHYWTGYYTSRPFYKHLDRVLEANLRSAEILFTLALTYARKNAASNFPTAALMQKIVESRRSLSLFQHHDAITGTAKDPVVNDYGRRLMRGLVNSKNVMMESAAFLVLKNKNDYVYNPEAPILSMDEVHENYESLSSKPVISLTSQPVPVILYNSLGHTRVQLVTVWVSQPHLKVQDPDGNIVHSQIEPFWLDENPEKMDSTKYKASFIARVPALGVAVYTIHGVSGSEDLQNHLVSTVFINSKSGQQQNGEFPIETLSGNENFSINNSMLEATFFGTTGFLKSVKILSTGTIHQTNLQFVVYGARNGKERSGAYIFLPDGPAQPLIDNLPLIRIMRGPLVSEVQVNTEFVQHVVRLVNSPGVDGNTLDIHNIVNIQKTANKELALRVMTDIRNLERVFYTDLNGFQMQRRQTLDKLPLQGNVYPMSTATFVQDTLSRLTILSAQALGVSCLQPGQIDVMLDRRLNQDDGRGLGQGVLDNRRTPNHFRLLFETRDTPLQTSIQTVGYLSLTAHLSSLYLTQPIFLMPKSGVASGTSLPLAFWPRFSPLQTELPCQLHLLNLRTMQNKDDSPDLRFIPKDSAALLFHHFGSDCDFPIYTNTCQPNEGQLTLAKLFKDIQFHSAVATSLTLMYDQQEVDVSSELHIPHMEIKTFKVILS